MDQGVANHVSFSQKDRHLRKGSSYIEMHMLGCVTENGLEVTFLNSNTASCSTSVSAKSRRIIPNSWSLCTTRCHTPLQRPCAFPSNTRTTRLPVRMVMVISVPKFRDNTITMSGFQGPTFSMNWCSYPSKFSGLEGVHRTLRTSWCSSPANCLRWG